MRKYWLLLAIPLILVSWWLLRANDPAAQVHFSTVRVTRIESTVSTNGKVEPAQWASARAQSPGVVRIISIQRGETVKAGQPLVSMDSTQARSDLAEALARVAQAEAENATLGQGGKASQLANINDSIRGQQSVVDTAQRNYDSLQRLLPQQASTKLQVDEARDALVRAQQQLSALQNQRRTLVTANDKAIAQARLQEQQAAVEAARHRVALDVIRAPITGTVYQFDLKIGSFLQAGDLVASIGDLDEVKVAVYVDEPDLGRVQLNHPVAITWDARPGQKWWGRVDRLPTEVITLGSRTVGEVSTMVNNPNHDLLPGVTVNASIVSRVVDNAVSIPKAALRNMRGQNGVYKLTGDTVTWTPVTTGISDITNVQILSGVQKGDRVADRVIEPADTEMKSGLGVKPVID